MRFIEEKIFKVLMILATLLVFAFVGNILYTILERGLPALNWDMISKLPSGGFYIGGEGGLLNAIMGSLYIVGGSTLLGLLISIPVVFYLNVYLTRQSKLAYLGIVVLSAGSTASPPPGRWRATWPASSPGPPIMSPCSPAMRRSST